MRVLDVDEILRYAKSFTRKGRNSEKHSPRLKLTERDSNGMPKSYTFDDVAIVPTSSFNIESRDDIKDIGRLVVNAAMTFFADEEFVKTAAGLDSLLIYNIPRVGLSDSERIQTAKTYRSHSEKTAFITIGVKESKDFLTELKELYNDLFIPSIDIANGTTKGVIRILVELAKLGIDEVSVGNVGSFVETEALIRVLSKIEFHNNYIKVGIGPGAACTTRVTTGVGMGQLSAIDASVSAMNFMNFHNKDNIKVIADGGVRKPADFVKSIAAGADMVMMGQYLLTVDAFSRDKIECIEGDRCYFYYYGMASKPAKNGSKRYIEGTELHIPLNDDTLYDRLQGLYDGLRSAMSYVGATSLDEFYHYAEFTIVTPASTREGMPLQ